MPMAIWRPAYFREVIDGLRAIDPACLHFTLTARPATLAARIRQSGGAVERQLAHRLPCTTALATSDFATHIATDEPTPNEIDEAISAAPAGVAALAPE